MNIFLILSTLLYICVLGTHCWSDNRVRKFKKDFSFGVATSAYQVEGAWNKDGKGESIWDRYHHDHPELIKDGRNGDEACDSYHRYERDVEMLRELGVHHYKFSISWSRLLPNGLPDKINEKAVEYYDNLINELLKYNIQPMVSMYNLDLPQKLQDMGGWTNPLVSEWFEEYARIIFEKFADRVKLWITINNPTSVCFETYSGIHAPGIISKGIGDYLCVKNVLIAHARAYRLYESSYKKKYKGNVGISLLLNWPDAFNNKTDNEQAAETYRDFTIGMYMDPIWSKYGDFPLTVRNTIAKKSKEQGYTRSRLPTLTSEEIKLIKGSSDFLGLNHYTTYLIKASNVTYPGPSIEDDMGVETVLREEWKMSQTSWLRSAPYGIYKLSLYLNKKYDYLPMYITEQGWSTTAGLNDRGRVDYIREYLIALLFAIEDGSDVKGYTLWSLMDTVEWNAGTSERFGLYEVDFESEEKTRKARLSALVYKRIIQKRIIEKEWEPKHWVISITNKTTNKDEL